MIEYYYFNTSSCVCGNSVNMGGMWAGCGRRLTRRRKTWIPVELLKQVEFRPCVWKSDTKNCRHYGELCPKAVIAAAPFEDKDPWAGSGGGGVQGGVEGHLRAGVGGKVDCTATNDTSTWKLSSQLPAFPAIFTSISHFYCRLTEATTRRKMIFVAGRIWAGLYCQRITHQMKRWILFL